MAKPLEEWQRSLEDHFSALASTRASAGLPVFALEHNLTNADLEEISRYLHSTLKANFDLGKNWLVWVIYATEHGYNYDGAEYWPSFQNRTPFWEGNDKRQQLKRWFKKFHTSYNGVNPSGTWANNFPIISWPITHAILPRYFQILFARTLHEARYKLASLREHDPVIVGEILAAHAWDTPSRFQEFLQQEELAGRIVIALLNKTAENQNLIYSTTLERVVTDLERAQNAREWLNETRRFFKDKFLGTGNYNSISNTPHTNAGNDNRGRPFDVSPKIKPNLLMRHSGPDSWSVVLDIPNFNGVAKINQELGTFLRKVRCKISCDVNNWRTAGWLLSGPQRSVLKSWPDTSKPLIEFEQDNSVLNLLLEECRISEGSIWLCRIGEDGIAREVNGRIVRPGQKYIYLVKESSPSESRFLTPCKVNCEGINAFQLSVPETLTENDILQLQSLGVQIARTIRVWPIGLCARAWDGEGQSEWLTTETPCFAIVDDHPVESYSLRLNDGMERIVQTTNPGVPIFIQIDALPPGKHILHIKPRRNTSADQSTLAWDRERFITLKIRTPEAWAPGTTLHSGLSISLDPYSPNLDDFWQEKISVTVLGPEARSVNCIAFLESADKSEMLAAQIGLIDLPITPDNWSRKFRQYIAANKNNAWKYLEASSGRFLIKAEELGEYTIHLERNIKPLRWVCRDEKNAIILRLVDDTDQDSDAKVSFLSFKQPISQSDCNTSECLKGFEPTSPGGLFIARHGNHTDLLILSTPQIEGGFSGFQIEPDIRGLGETSEDIIGVLNLLAHWKNARHVGPLAEMRSDYITKKIHDALYMKLCGTAWSRAENFFFKDTAIPSRLEELKRCVGGKAGFAAAIYVNSDEIDTNSKKGIEWFSEVCKRYGICNEADLCEFALLIAEQPHKVPSLYNEQTLMQRLEELKSTEDLLRGARLLSVLVQTKDSLKKVGQS